MYRIDHCEDKGIGFSSWVAPCTLICIFNYQCEPESCPCCFAHYRFTTAGLPALPVPGQNNETQRIRVEVFNVDVNGTRICICLYFHRRIHHQDDFPEHIESFLSSSP